MVDFIIDFRLTTEINTFAGLQKLKVSLSCINVYENRSMDNPNLNTPLVSVSLGVFYGANMIKFFLCLCIITYTLDFSWHMLEWLTQYVISG